MGDWWRGLRECLPQGQIRSGSVTIQAGLGSPGVAYGSTYYTDKAWVYTDSQEPADNDGHIIKLPIYAFSNELTVPADTGTGGGGPIQQGAVPLPSAAEMTAAGAVLLALQGAARRLKSRA